MNEIKSVEISRFFDCKYTLMARDAKLVFTRSVSLLHAQLFNHWPTEPMIASPYALVLIMRRRWDVFLFWAQMSDQSKSFVHNHGVSALILLHVAPPEHHTIRMTSIFCDCPNLFRFFEPYLTNQAGTSHSCHIILNSEPGLKENEKNASHCQNGEDAGKIQCPMIMEQEFTLIGPHTR
jgi:hypothetical protein